MNVAKQQTLCVLRALRLNQILFCLRQVFNRKGAKAAKKEQSIALQYSLALFVFFAVKKIESATCRRQP